MSRPDDLHPHPDDPPIPDPTPAHPLLLAQIQSFQDLAARLDTLEASQTSLRNDLHALGERLSDLSEEAQAVQSFGWDYVALVQRLSSLEQMLAPAPPASSADAPPHPRGPATPLPDH